MPSEEFEPAEIANINIAELVITALFGRDSIFDCCFYTRWQCERDHILGYVEEVRRLVSYLQGERDTGSASEAKLNDVARAQG